MPNRVKDADRLTHRFMVNCTARQHATVLAEAEDSGMAPSIIARMAFAEGLAKVRNRGNSLRNITKMRERKRAEKGNGVRSVRPIETKEV